ncbi:MAG: GTP cyclohydrolase 1 [Candidatus Mesenet longicola]|uniref:GTP cyclohydrolase 1 n=1 Tax=Candidatus Mesenet longicola TaxID=1892558 RepID=A0A8J3HQW8_9RICK|nr:MAG: GTP cyclohydrolase 1 [Candidatus Mesenet longicola]GHM59968.1 MAG: GTP cyclohydrolase 1 [Candidatus Mesenet longicola]
MKTPSDQEAQEALKLLIKWIGDDPYRAELISTPQKVLNAYRRLFCGYQLSAEEVLRNGILNCSGCKGMVTLQNINFLSYCEHQMLPIEGIVNIAYIPDEHIIGISKLTRLIDVFAQRLQVQERLTKQIADSINTYLKPKGVAVFIEAKHLCLGHNSDKTTMQTISMLGVFEIDPNLRQEFFLQIKNKER